MERSTRIAIFSIIIYFVLGFSSLIVSVQQGTYCRVRQRVDLNLNAGIAALGQVVAWPLMIPVQVLNEVSPPAYCEMKPGKN